MKWTTETVPGFGSAYRVERLTLFGLTLYVRWTKSPQ